MDLTYLAPPPLLISVAKRVHPTNYSNDWWLHALFVGAMQQTACANQIWLLAFFADDPIHAKLRGTNKDREEEDQEGICPTEQPTIVTGYGSLLVNKLWTEYCMALAVYRIQNTMWILYPFQNTKYSVQFRLQCRLSNLVWMHPPLFYEITVLCEINFEIVPNWHPSCRNWGSKVVLLFQCDWKCTIRGHACC